MCACGLLRMSQPHGVIHTSHVICTFTETPALEGALHMHRTKELKTCLTNQIPTFELSLVCQSTYIYNELIVTIDDL